MFLSSLPLFPSLVFSPSLVFLVPLNSCLLSRHLALLYIFLYLLSSPSFPLSNLLSLFHSVFHRLVFALPLSSSFWSPLPSFHFPYLLIFLLFPFISSFLFPISFFLASFCLPYFPQFFFLVISSFSSFPFSSHFSALSFDLSFSPPYFILFSIVLPSLFPSVLPFGHLFPLFIYLIFLFFLLFPFISSSLFPISFFLASSCLPYSPQFFLFTVISSFSSFPTYSLILSLYLVLFTFSSSVPFLSLYLVV